MDFGSNWDTSDGFAERDTAALAALKSPKRRDYVAESATALAVSTQVRKYRYRSFHILLDKLGCQSSL